MMYHYQESIELPADINEVFSFVDDHKSFSGHMRGASFMMGGGKMEVSTDREGGQRLGSHIRMKGKAFGAEIELDEVITKYEPPRIKEYETVGTPRLIVVGKYKMSIKIEPAGSGSRLTVSIDYDYPQKNSWLGKLFGGTYAKWCVGQMIRGTYDHFAVKYK